MLEQGAPLRILPPGAWAHKDPQEGSRLISAGADNAGRMYDVQTGQSTQIAKHDAPIRVVKYVDTPSGGIVVTGSWDKTIKVRDYHSLDTDTRSPGCSVLGHPESKPRIICNSP